ncbi:glycosyltransferase [Lacinutrix sp. WUR7]|uniref:glycosyltransferase n=1 Tax=Lacinutrix sp. WUR7 TaxID=2653681 RepID=UPI00193DE0AE|nr:glycosyltransferase [Lacinutrix sp. WUR7]QRM87793.1 glycosyltransferase [Lacinutrix sp. WUR7]
MVIPKTIHYCWFGEKEKPKVVKECIASWRKILVGYVIKEWNETNVDLSNPFVKYAYRQKKWAFVSDYIRLKILHTHGGIYLDTDMFFLKPIDSFLNNDLFVGAEEDRFISCGIIGAIPNHPFIQKGIERYDTMDLTNIEFHKITIPKILTASFRAYYNFYEKFDKLITIDKVLVCPKNYFYPYSYEDSEITNRYMDFRTSDTYAIHLWNKSWMDHSEFYYLKKRQYFKACKTAITNLSTGTEALNVKYVKMLGYSIKQSFKKK